MVSTLSKSLTQVTNTMFNSLYGYIWKPLTNMSPLTAVAIGISIEVGLSLMLYKRFGKRNDSPNFLMAPSEIRKDEKRQRAVDKVKPPEIWNGAVIFFPDLSPEKPGSPTSQLIWFFQQAKFRIQLCIYLSSYPPIENVILEKINEGVLVQVITDYDTSTSHNNFNVTRWRQRGTEVKLKPTGYLMHNKFAIIDEQAVLTGSLNWTKQGITINCENVLVSTDYRIVDKYMEEYDKIWTSCDTV